LSGTVEIEKQHAWMNQREQESQKQHELRMSELRQDNERLDKIILQMKKETEQIERENARLAELESKIDGLFFKYNINCNPQDKPEQP